MEESAPSAWLGTVMLRSCPPTESPSSPASPPVPEQHGYTGCFSKSLMAKLPSGSVRAAPTKEKSNREAISGRIVYHLLNYLRQQIRNEENTTPPLWDTKYLVICLPSET